MRVAIHVGLAVGLALMPIGDGQAAKPVHKSHNVQVSNGVQRAPDDGQGGYGQYGGNAAAAGNNANSMSGSNSAVENAIGRTNCC